MTSVTRLSSPQGAVISRGDPPRRLFHRFEDTASALAADTALTFLSAEGGSRSYTYGELFDRVLELSDVLRRRSLPDDRPLGVLLHRQEDQVVHYLAALAAGLVPAILTPPNRKLNREYYARTTAAVLDRSRFGAVITDVDGLALSTLTLSAARFERTGGSASPGDPRDGHLDGSFLQFSSGTTGLKRGVLVTDDAVLAQLDTYGRALNLDGDDRILSWLPLYHDMGFIACLNLPLAAGIHTVMIDPIDWVSNPRSFLEAVDRYRATISWNPNFAYAFMAQRVPELPQLDLSSLRGLVNCSEPVTADSQRLFLDRFSEAGLRSDVFWGCYGMAETTFALTHGTPADPGALDDVGPTDGTWMRSSGNVSVGRPLPGVELRIVDHVGSRLQDREVGEIQVRSPFDFQGYFNHPEATAAAFDDGWYRTGDLGYLAGGALYVPGRSKDVLIVGGVNVFPHDVEDTVGRADGIVSGRVSAFSDFDERLQTERIVVLAESDLEGDERRRTVLRIRQEVLAAFQIGNFELHLVEPGWLIKSSSGKMARSANRTKWTEDR